MRRGAWIYVIGVLLSACVLGIFAFINFPVQAPPVWAFLVLTFFTTLMRIYHIIAPDHRSYEGSTIAFMAGILLLPAWLFVIQVVIAQSIEWVWIRSIDKNSLKAWYLQPFNMAKCIIGGILAGRLANLIEQAPPPGWQVSELAMYLVAILIYVAVNQFLLGLALWIARGVTFREAGIIRDGLLIELPLACIGFVAFELFYVSPLTVLFVLAPIVLIYQVFMLPKVQDEAMKALEGMNRELTQANLSVSRLNAELFHSLARVFDMRDPYVGGHAAQVATYAVAIGQEMGLPTERIELIRQSAYLHDIGKLAIPEVILHKPGKLTEIEYQFVKKHADIGADLLASTEGLKHLAPFVRHHHERWDGCGYPMGLAGEEIPLEARILNVCDSVESMASDRPYHRGMSIREITDEIRRCAGSQFDPQVAEVFGNLIQQRGPFFVVNSARSVAQQYAASLLANESLTYNMFGWVLEQEAQKQPVPVKNQGNTPRTTKERINHQPSL